MSARVQLSVGIGTLAVMLIMTVGVLYFTKAGVNQSEQNNNDMQDLKKENAVTKKILTDYIDKWDRRVNTSNAVNNVSRDLDLEQEKQLINLAKNQTLILKQQVANEQNIIGNLTAHRVIANLSNANQTEILNEVLNLTSGLTSDEYNKQAENKVHSIIGNMTAEHEIIFKALNITTMDNATDAEDELAILKEQIEAIENKTK